MKKILKRLATGFLAFATIVTALPTTAVHASEKQYWTESAERVGIIEKVMNDGSIGSTFNEGYMKVEGETAYCVDINTNFKNGYKTRAGRKHTHELRPDFRCCPSLWNTSSSTHRATASWIINRSIFLNSVSYGRD